MNLGWSADVRRPEQISLPNIPADVDVDAPGK